MAECVVDGVVYIGIPHTEGCNGCVAIKPYGRDIDLCHSLDVCREVVWVKKESQTITEETLVDSHTEPKQTAELIEVFPIMEAVSEIGHQGNTFYFSSLELANAAKGVIDKGFGVVQLNGGVRCVKVDGTIFKLGKDIELSDNDPLFAEVIEQEKLVNQAIAKLSCDEAEALKNYFGGKK